MLNMISDYDYEMYKNMPKLQREIKIGILQRNNSKIADAIKEGIKIAKRNFFIANDIKDENVLAIKNDAILLINQIPKYTVFDNIEFANKSTYTSFMNLNKIKFYYMNDRMNSNEILDIDGISDIKQIVHSNYMLEFIKEVFDILETESVANALELINIFYNQYVSLSLDLEYYRELNSQSLYRLKDINSIIYGYCVETLNSKDKKYLDISYNLNLIRTIYQLISIEILKNR